MRFNEVFDSCTDRRLLTDMQARLAVQEFKRNIPAQILQVQFETAHSNTQIFRNDNKLYKLGYDRHKCAAYIEFFETNVQIPTMSIYVDRSVPLITINGRQDNKRFDAKFFISNGTVQKAMQIV